MLVGAYPFVDLEDTRNFNKTLQRITLPEVKNHPWYLKKLPKELVEGEKAAADDSADQSDQQSTKDIEKIIRLAKMPGEGSNVIGECGLAEEESDLNDELDLEAEIAVTSD